MKLLFLGDVNFRGHENLKYEESKDILSEVQPYLDRVNFRIANLETPLADKNKYKPIKKSGPNHIYNSENVVFLKALNADAVTLANNHIGDFGEGAVKDTLDLLDKNNILYSGAGENIEKAYEAFCIKKEGKTVAVISVCENEFGTSSENKYGTAGYNPRRLLNQIKKEKSASDYVIVVFHGGNEFNPLPSTAVTDRYRMICDMGADAVIATHTHCPQGYEIYNDKPIVYSMGNFLFKSSCERHENDTWYYGYMSELTIDEKISLEVIPYKFNKEATKITVFKNNQRENVMNYLKMLCDIIQNPKELSLYFKGWCMLHKWCPVLPDDYENLDGYNSSGNFNIVSCEAHCDQLRELLRLLDNDETEISEKYSEKIKKLMIINENQ